MHPSKQRAAAHPLAAYLFCFNDVSITELVCLGLPYLYLQQSKAQFSLLFARLQLKKQPNLRELGTAP
jgi:hypothetical protein